MEKKRIIQIVVMAIVLCGIVAIGIGCNRQFKEEQRKVEAEQRSAEEAERMELIHTHFEELVSFAQEHQENIEKLSVASVEQMLEVMDIDEFDYEKACEVADIGEDADVIKEKFYINAGTIMRSIESAKECPETCPNVIYDYRGVGLGSTDMFLLYYYSDIPEKAWKYDGSGSNYDGYEKITENLYAIWFEPPYT